MNIWNEFQKIVKKQFNWKLYGFFISFILLAVAFLLWTCFLDKFVTVSNVRFFIWMMPKNVAVAVLAQFSGTFFVLALLTITVERVFKAFLKKDIDIYTFRIAENVHDAIFGNFTPKEILSSVKQQVILSSFIYRNYNAEFIAEEIVEEAGIRYIKFSSFTVFDIENISEISRKFKGKIAYSYSEFHHRPKPIEHEKLQIRYKNKPILVLDSDACKKKIEEGQDEEKWFLPYEVEIPGEDKVEFQLLRTLYFKNDSDFINTHFTRPTVGFNIRLEFPSDAYNLFCHPSLQETEKYALKKDIKHHGKEIDISYEGALLPYQGVIIEWKAK